VKAKNVIPAPLKNWKEGQAHTISPYSGDEFSKLVL
jgi:hypothetical protein